MTDLPADAKSEKIPDWKSPMLATLTHDYFSDPGWIYERKFDGERCLIFCKNGKIRLLSRNKKQLNNTYPELVEAFTRKQKDFIADGEIVAFDGNVTSFSRLQQRMKLNDRNKSKQSKIAVYYYLFDLLHYDGYDLTGLPIHKRKALLKNLIKFRDPFRYTAHRNTEGIPLYKEACKKGWEGVIAKRRDSRYHSSRSRDWLKFKCVHQQEFVIVGYTDPKGSRKGFGALMIGYYENDELHYAGMVGTGYDDDMLETLHNRLKKIQRTTCPVVDRDAPWKSVHWVTPRLVAEIGFTEWTKKGRLRHPRFLGLRRDKEPRQVVREDTK